MPCIHNVGGVRPQPFFIRASCVTTGNGTGTKNVLKWSRALGFVSTQSSVYGATTVVKVSLFYSQPGYGLL